MKQLWIVPMVLVCIVACESPKRTAGAVAPNTTSGSSPIAAESDQNQAPKFKLADPDGENPISDEYSSLRLVIKDKGQFSTLVNSGFVLNRQKLRFPQQDKNQIDTTEFVCQFKMIGDYTSAALKEDMPYAISQLKESTVVQKNVRTKVIRFVISEVVAAGCIKPIESMRGIMVQELADALEPVFSIKLALPLDPSTDGRDGVEFGKVDERAKCKPLIEDMASETLTALTNLSLEIKSIQDTLPKVAFEKDKEQLKSLAAQKGQAMRSVCLSYQINRTNRCTELKEVSAGVRAVDKTCSKLLGKDL